MLETVVYVSAAAPDLDGAEVQRILTISRRNNERDGVTGVLCFVDGSFIQALEGDPDVLDATLARIRLDPRHRGFLQLYRAPIEKRGFGHSPMGYPQAAEQSGFVLSGADMCDVVARDADGVVKTLLKYFHHVSDPTYRSWGPHRAA